MTKLSSNLVRLSLSCGLFLAQVPLYAQDAKTTPTAANPAAQTASETLTDGQIIGILNTANQGEIQAGKLAEKQSKNPQVKEFASMMVKEHTAARSKVKELAGKTNLKMAESPLQKTLETTAKESENKLKALKDKEFDTAYISEQVKMHQMTLDTIDSTLLPKANEATLKSELGKMRETVASHLDHAKKLEASLGQLSTSR